MAVKKSDLYSFLWASCDELRGDMHASQYEDYGVIGDRIKTEIIRQAMMQELLTGRTRVVDSAPLAQPDAT